MKKQDKQSRLLETVLLVLPAIPLLAYLLSPKQARPIQHFKKQKGKTYQVPAKWKGVPVDRKNRFVNYKHPFYQNYSQILFWIPGHAINLIRNRSKAFPVVYHSNNTFLTKDNTLIWLGHASFFLRINNKNILIDPHFYNTSIYHRHTAPPIPPDLFTNIDYILLSHDHEDHCDERSLTEVVENNPDVTVLSGLNMDALVRQITKNKQLTVVTAQWYEKFDVADSSVDFYFVPSRHYCHRPFNKYNSRLWGGFIMKYKSVAGNETTLYFAGDSAYDSHFKEIGSLF